MSDETIIHVENLTKIFGRIVAIDNLSFEVKRGEILGFLGPNGAGKTTTMRILAGFLPATGGNVRVAGFDVYKNSLAARQRLGYLPESVPLYNEMRVNEYLAYRGRIKGLGGRRLSLRIDEVTTDCGLDEVRHALIGRVSKGYRQRIGLADSLLHEPDLLILDEPTIGLDPNQIRHIRNLIKSFARRHTVLLSSHILHEVEMICERVLIINRGRIVASDTPSNLMGLLKGTPQVILEARGPRPEILAALESLPGVQKVTWEPVGEWLKLICDCHPGVDVRADVFRLMSDRRWTLRELAAERRNLEDVFVAMTTEAEGGS